MKFRKLGSAVLASAIIASVFAGCSSKAASSGGTANTANKATITLMTSGTKATNGADFDTETFVNEVHKAFPNVNVQATKLPDDQYYTSLKSKLATGQAPDLFLVQPKSAGANAVTSLAAAGYLADLSDLKCWSNLPAGSKDDMSYNGKPYALSSGDAFLGVYYNKKMFSDNGLKVPTNWDEFLNVCKTLKAKGITPIEMGDKDSYVIQFGLYQIAANVVYPADPKFDTELSDGKVKFTDAKWVKAIDMYKTLYTNGYVESSSLGIGATQAIQAFVDGKAAMTFDGTFNASALQAKGAAEFERGFFAMPANAAGQETYVSGAAAAGYGVYSKSKNVEICKQILNLMTDGKSDLFKAWSTDPRQICVYKGVPLQNPLFTDVVKTYQEGKSFYWCNQAWPSGTETEMENEFSQIIGGQNVSAASITAGMQKKYDELKES